MKEAKFFAPVITHSPLLTPILKKIIEKYDIPEVNQTGNGLKERLFYEIEDNYRIDWAAVRQDIEDEVTRIPDLLPPELAIFRKLIDEDNNLKPEIEITEPCTDKLRNDIQAFNKMYNDLHHFATDMIAVPWLSTMSKAYSAIIDNLLIFIYSGTTREIPSEWISVVTSMPIFGEDVIMAMADRLADPEEIVKQFREQYINTFGKHRPKISRVNLRDADYLGMRLEGMPIEDIADEYIQRHKVEYPQDPLDSKYKKAKRDVTDILEKSIRRSRLKMEAILGDKITRKSVP